MDEKQFRKALEGCNLSELDRRCGISARTLRRIKNGSGEVRASTIAAVEPHIKGCKIGKNETRKRVERARATRALRVAAV